VSVFLVTSGSYSDYSVCAAFTTRELAEKAVIDLFGGERDGYCAIEEFVLDPKVRGESNEEFYIVGMRRNGDVARIFASSPSAWIGDVDRVQNDCLWAYMWARDKEHAIKIANERRTVLLATEQWEAT